MMDSLCKKKKKKKKQEKENLRCVTRGKRRMVSL